MGSGGKRGVRIVAFFISSHEQTQLIYETESAVFLYCRFSLLLTDPFSRLFRGRNSC